MNFRRTAAMALAILITTGSISTAAPAKAVSQNPAAVPAAKAAGAEESGECGADAVYTLKDGVLTISGTGAISEYSFSSREDITSVVIEEGITNIAYDVFNSCTNLKTVSLPSTLKTIGSSAFSYCSSLEEIVIPDGVKVIEYYAFSGCEALRSVTLPKELTTVESQLFQDCTSLEEIEIPGSVTVINSEAFSYCSSLRSLTIPKSVTNFSSDAVNYCSGLETLTVLNPELEIGGEIKLPSSAVIEGYAGSDAELLARKSYLTFRDLETGEESLSGQCGDAVTFEISEDGVLTITGEGDMYEGYTFPGSENVTAVEIGEGVTSISDYAFSSFYNLKSVSLPGTLKSIEGNAFRWCYDLSAVTLNDGLEHIGASAFYGCSMLKEIDIPETVDTISPSAFSYCSGLETLTLNNKTCAIGSDAFPSGSQFTLRGYSGSTAEDYASSSGVRFTDIETGRTFIMGPCGEGLSYTIDDNGVLTITGDGEIENDPSFRDKEGITDIVFDGKITAVGDNAFISAQVENIVLPESVANIGSTPLNSSYCRSITIPNKECVIEDSSSTIPSSIVIIGYSGSTAETYARKYGKKFKDIETGEITQAGNLTDDISYSVTDGVLTISGKGVIPDYDTYDTGSSPFCNNTEITSAVIEKGITTIGSSLLRGCSGIKEVTIPEGVTAINNYAFGGCEGLTDISLPDTLKTIGYSAFYNCTSLVSVTIPASVEKLEYSALSSCYVLDEVTVLNPECVLESSALGSRSATVICGYKDSTAQEYASLNGQKFRDIETGEISISGKCGENAYYELSKDNVLTITGSGPLDNNQIAGGTDAVSVVISDGITSIGDSNFYNYSSLTSVEIPASVKSIGSSAFAYCDELTELVIPNAECELDTEYTICPESVTIAGHTGSPAHTYARTFGNKFRDLETGKITQSGKCGENLEYSIDNGVLTITGTGDMDDYPPFQNNEEIKAVIIEDGVTSIGKYAFYYCSELSEITIPDSVTSIGERAFYGCSSLTAISLPKDLTYIGMYAFCECRGLTSIVIPDKTETIDNDAFSYCYNLESVTFGKSLKTIGSGAFNSCGKMKTVTIPENVQSIGGAAFFSYELTEADILAKDCEISSSAFNESTVIGGYEGSAAKKYAFENGRKFKDLETGIISQTGSCGAEMTYTISDDTITISGKGEMDIHPTFSGNSTIKKAVIEEGVTSVGAEAFQYCSSLTSISLPASLTDIAASSFTGSSVKNVELSNDSKSLSFSGGFLCSADEKTLIAVFSDSSSIKVPETVQIISDSAFCCTPNATRILIPESVKKIETSALREIPDGAEVTVSSRDCDISMTGSTFNKTAVICGYSGSTAEAYALEYGRIFKDAETGSLIQKGKCGDDAVYSVENGVMTISGTGAIYDSLSISGKDNIKSIVIGKGITSVGSASFSGFRGVSSVSLPDTLESIGSSAFQECSTLTSIEIPDSVKTIESSAFIDCSGLTSVKLPEGLTEIGPSTFEYCSSLMRINLPDTVKNIGSYAFYGCSSLTLSALPESLETMGYSVFSGCSSIGSLTIPTGLKSLDSNVFYGCSDMEKITITSADCEIHDDSGTISWNTAIEGYAGSTAEAYARKYARVFIDIETGKASQEGICGENAAYTIENNVLTISGTGAMSDASPFMYNQGFKKVIIEEGITEISDDAFYSCSGITSVSLPSSLTRIGQDAFADCTGLKEVVIPETTSVLTICDDAFSSYTLNKITLLCRDCQISTSSYTLGGNSVIAGYSGSTAEGFAADKSRKFFELDTGKTIIRGKCGPDARYSIVDGVATVSGTGSTYSWSSFNETSSITELIIEEGITELDRYSFSSMDSLKKVTIPASVTYIAPEAFSYDQTLTDIRISADNKDYVFENGVLYSTDKKTLKAVLPNVRKIKIPDTVTVIGERAFTAADDIQEVTLPETVEKIEKGGFSNCSDLKKVTILGRDTQINEDPATICNTCDTSTDEEGISYSNISYSGILCGYADSTASEYAVKSGIKFMDLESGEITQKGKCGDNMDFVITNNVLTITGTGDMYDDPPFNKNDEITEVIISEGVETIGNNAFYQCYNLRKAALPTTLISIGSYAFYGDNSINTITLPDGLKDIGDGAFCTCSGLRSVVIPGSVDKIGDHAFSHSALNTLTIMDGVKTIGSNAFYSTKLTEADLPESVSDMESGAFGSLNSRTPLRITIRNKDCIIYASPETIDTKSVVYGYADSTAEQHAYSFGLIFTDLESGAVKQEGQCGDALFYSITNGDLIITGTGDMWDAPSFSNISNYKKVVMSEGITSIGAGAFSSAPIRSIDIPASVMTVDEYAFAGNHTLTSINVNEDNKDLVSVDGVLYNKDMTKIISYPGGASASTFVLPETIKTIGEGAFDSVKLKELEIRNKDADILGEMSYDLTLAGYKGSTAEEYAYSRERFFRDIETGAKVRKGRCGIDAVYELTENGDLTITGTGDMTSSFSYNYEIKTLTVGEGISSLTSEAFYNCGNLTKVQLPSTLKKIGSSTFSSCDMLTELSISEGTESIGRYAFYSTPLKTAELPASLKELDPTSFSYCTSLTGINVSPDCEAYASIDGVVYDKELSTIIAYPAGLEESITLPETAKMIPDGIFSNISAGIVLTIPSAECEIYDADSAINSNITICAPSGSKAEEYAYRYGKKFRALGTDKTVRKGPCGDSMSYTLDEEGTLTITGTGKMYDSPMFSGLSSIKKAVIESGAESIGSSAFNGCRTLEEITIPDTVTAIGDSAFAGTGLTSLDIPAQVASIGEELVYDSYYLKEINVSKDNKNYTSVNGVLFNKEQTELIAYPSSANAASYTVPDTVRTIDSYAFRKASYLTDIIIPEGVETIGSSAFGSVYRLKNITLPDSLTELGESAFYNCGSLVSVSIPKGLTQIAASTFTDCYSLREIELPEAVSFIGSRAFNYCSGLSQITILNSSCVITDGSSTIPAAAVICGHTDSTAQSYAYDNGRKFKNIDTDEIIQKGRCGTFLEYEIKDGVLTITGTGRMYDSPTFSGRDQITSVVISEGVTSIGTNAFQNCEKLTEVSLPSTVYELGSYSFSNCKSLTSVQLPDEITEIPECAFSNCTSLKEIGLPAALRIIGTEAFRNCNELSSVQFPETLETIGYSAFYSCNKLTSAELPEGLISVGTSAFYDTGLSGTVTIPASVQDLGVGCFGGNTKIAAFEVADGNTEYKSAEGIIYSADGKTLILVPYGIAGTTFTVPETAVNIADRAFSGCSSLTEVIVPETVQSINTNAFATSGEKVTFTIKSTDCTFDGTAGSLDNSRLTLCGHDGSTTEELASKSGIWFKSLETGDLTLSGTNGIAQYVLKDGVLTLSGSGYIYVYDSSTEKVIIGKDITGFDINTSNVTEYTADKDSKTYTTVDGVLYNKDMTSILDYPEQKKDTSFTIPDPVISASGLQNRYLTDLTIGKNTLMGELHKGLNGEEVPSFYFNGYLPALETISVSAGNKYHEVKDNVLYSKDMSQLVLYPSKKADKSFTVPESVEWILGIYNDSLESLTLGKNTRLEYHDKYIGEDGETREEVYYNVPISCRSLKEINAAEGSIYIVENGALYSSDKSVLLIYPDEKEDTALVLPDSVERIYALTNDHIREITAGPELTSLKYGFQGNLLHMPALEKVSLSAENKNLTLIGGIVYGTSTNSSGRTSPFIDCVPKAISGDITIADGVEYIDYTSFENCDSITSITLPNSVKYIYEYAFSDCDSLKKIVITSPDCIISYFDESTGRYSAYAKGCISNYTETDESGLFVDANYTGTIEAPEGSPAEKYADQFGYTFTKLGAEHSEQTTTTTTTTTKPATTTTTTATTTKPVTSTTTSTTEKASDPTTTTTTKKAVTVTTTTSKSSEDKDTTTQTSTTASPITTTTTTKPAEPDDPSGNSKLGDIDKDGFVDSTDASEILTVYAAISTGDTDKIDPDLMKECDVNGDGSVDSSDASLILEYYAFTQTGGTGTFEEFIKKREEEL